MLPKFSSPIGGAAGPIPNWCYTISRLSHTTPYCSYSLDNPARVGNTYVTCNTLESEPELVGMSS